MSVESSGLLWSKRLRYGTAADAWPDRTRKSAASQSSTGVRGGTANRSGPGGGILGPVGRVWFLAFGL